MNPSPEGTIRKPLYVACGSLLWLAAATAYLVLEAVASTGFRANYSYVHNYISDLGVTTAGMFDGRWLDSPQAEIMNTAFFLQGALLFMGTVFIMRGLDLHRAGGFLTLIAIESLGIILVAMFHSGSTDVANRTIIFHLIGAGAAIGSGLLAVLAGSAIFARDCNTPHWYRPLSVGLVVLSMTSFVMLGINRVLPAVHILPDGLLERAGVYALFTWPVVTGALLIGQLWRPDHVTAVVGEHLAI